MTNGQYGRGEWKPRRTPPASARGSRLAAGRCIKRYLARHLHRILSHGTLSQAWPVVSPSRRSRTGICSAHLAWKPQLKRGVKRVMTDQVFVPFEGEDSGSADLTWGQWDMWPRMRMLKSSMSVGGWIPLPGGTTVSDVAGDLRFLICRHQALRTRLAFTGDDRPQQVVARAGEVPMQVVEAGGEDPAQVAADLHRRYDAYVFD